MVTLRSILFQIFFWTFSAIINIAWLPALLLPRQATARGMAIWARVSFWGLKHIAGLDFEVRGRENIPKGPALYAGKHLSMWETVAPHVLFDDPATVMKRQLLYIPFYGWYARKVEMIVIDREAGAKTIRAMIAAAKQCIAEGRPIVIFPEGTRQKLGAPADYKPGVAALYAALDVPCVPFAHNSGLYWPRRGLLRKPGKIIVEALPAIPAGLKRVEFMAELERRIEEATARLLAEGGFQKASA
ncbi:MAG: lysophospholipid acyltransferase family protein [Micropepsaceae bacterium]